MPFKSTGTATIGLSVSDSKSAGRVIDPDVKMASKIKDNAAFSPTVKTIDFVADGKGDVVIQLNSNSVADLWLNGIVLKERK